MQAKEQLSQIEFQILNQAKEKIATLSKELNDFAQTIAWLDIFSSQAILSKEKKYTKPEFTKQYNLQIE